MAIHTSTIRERPSIRLSFLKKDSIISLYINWNNLYRQGVSIKPNLSIGSPAEIEDRNDKLYRQSIEISVRGEWRREIPITDFIDVINFCVEFGVVDSEGDYNESPNLQINTEIELGDLISDSEDFT